MSIEKIKYQLAVTYRMFAYLGFDDLTYAHLSARCPANPDHYYIYPLGLLFEEVTPDNLLTVNLDGNIINGSEAEYNQTGYVIHGSIYKVRPDLDAVFHLHTTASVAVSCLQQGLIPLSQFAMHFYDNYGRSKYDALALDFKKQGQDIADDLAQYKTLFLDNHGIITCGETIAEAFCYTHFLEQACRVQCNLMSQLNECVVPPHEVCVRARNDMRNFEKDFGSRDWNALERKILRLGLLSDMSAPSADCKKNIQKPTLTVY